MVEAKNIRKIYQVGDMEINAVNGVNLTVNTGEFVTIMGPSGSGKSTLMHIIGGIDNPTCGEVWIEGKCLSKMNDVELTLFRRENIGFVFQFFNLMPQLTVEENILLPLQIIGRKVIWKELKEILELMGLSGKQHHKPGQISGGEQQRVAIARAFIIDPKIVLLDEPTGNLDSKNGQKILELLSAAHLQFKKTIIMVTHNPIAAEYAEKTIFMKDGLVVDTLAKKAGNYSAKVINDKMCQL